MAKKFDANRAAMEYAKKILTEGIDKLARNNPCPRTGQLVVINSFGDKSSIHRVIAQYVDGKPTGRLTCLTCRMVYDAQKPS
jgi:hypothetical protein